MLWLSNSTHMFAASKIRYHTKSASWEREKSKSWQKYWQATLAHDNTGGACKPPGPIEFVDYFIYFRNARCFYQGQWDIKIFTKLYLFVKFVILFGINFTIARQIFMILYKELGLFKIKPYHHQINCSSSPFNDNWYVH